MVEPLKKNSGWYYIHCADRYPGWIDDEAIVFADWRILFMNRPGQK